MVKVTVPSAADVAKKWGDVTPGRSTYYEKGAVGAGSKWEAGATAASKTYQSAVSAGGIEARFKGGVKRAGAAKFDRKVKEIGVGRFGAGVTAAVPDMESGVGPFLTEIAATEIDARQPRGSPANVTGRVSKLADALFKKRMQILGAGGA